MRFAFGPAVRAALAAGRPVVALESSIISQGMPYPQNLEVARAVEDVVRAHGATPATIAIIKGVPTIGVEGDDLELLGTSPDVTKASRRDVAFAMATGGTAATTVASTMLLCHQAGVRVFATGGIGGVHRGAEETFDVSADLAELGRTPVTVVCSGVKSILDIAKTLEVLESQGVAVVGFGCENGEFPSFFTNQSGGLRAPLNVDGAADGDGARIIAGMMRSAAALRMEGGIVVAAPNPEPAEESVINSAIDSAVANAIADGVEGSKVTPYILKAVAAATGGSSLHSNIALVMNNAAVASRIACAHAAAEGAATAPTTPTTPTLAGARARARAVVIGGAAVDVHLAPTTGLPLDRFTSNPGTMGESWGGVGRNIAVGIAALANDGDEPTAMVTAVGDDATGAALLAHMSSAGVDVQHAHTVPALPTASYTAVMDEHGDLAVAIAAMDVLSEIDVSCVRSAYCDASTSFAIVDGNVAPGVMRTLAEARATSSASIWFEPTSVAKSTLPIESGSLDKIDIVSPNVLELVAMVKALQVQGGGDRGDAAVDEALHIAEGSDLADRLGEGEGAFGEEHLAVLACTLWRAMGSVSSTAESPLLRGKHCVVTCGADGLFWVTDATMIAELNGESEGATKGGATKREAGGMWLRSDPIVAFASATGAGDAFVAGSIHSLLREPSDAADRELRAFRHGIENARAALMRPGA